MPARAVLSGSLKTVLPVFQGLPTAAQRFSGCLEGSLKTLGEELRFAMLVSKITLQQGDAFAAEVAASAAPKCERCWHYVATVGTVAGHKTVCARCAENVDGEGESRAHV